MLRFLAATLFAFTVAGVSHAQQPLRVRLDAHVAEAWKTKKITPAKPATDSEFLRRVYLDLTGSVPTYEETLAFLDSKEPDKRTKLIDKLLDDPRHARHQADMWDQILFGRNPPGYDTDKRDGFQNWLRMQFEKNVPYDQWVKQLLRADGDSVDGGALYYVQYSRAPEDTAEAVSQTFLGVQLQCSRCHDHPYEEWKQKDFYGLAAFFARLEVVTAGKKGMQTVYAIGEQDIGDVLFTGPAKDAVPGKKGEPVKPKFLHGPALEEPPTPAKAEKVKFTPNQMPKKPKFSRLEKLADWITAPDNPYFAKAIANRVWAQFLGRGLIHPVDNMSPSNKANLPELLEEITKELIARKFDLKWTIRELVNSQTYQLSSSGSGEAFPEWYQHARFRPLSAEELAESWRVVSGYDAAEAKKPNPSRYRPFDGYLLQFFGTPVNGTGDFSGGLQEHLYLNNGPLSQVISGVKGGLVEQVGNAKLPVETRVERLFLQALHRKPTTAEAEKFKAFLTSGGSATDAVWVQLTCSEFRFNH